MLSQTDYTVLANKNEFLQESAMTAKYHPSFSRLVESVGGVDDRDALADLLGQTRAVVNNWATRPTGVSKEGALVIEAKTGISPTWILTGKMPPNSSITHDDDLSALRSLYAAIGPEFRAAALSAATNAMISFLSPHTSA